MPMLKREILALIRKGSFARAIGMAAEFTRHHPQDAAGFELIAMAEEAAGYTRAAIQTISHAVELAPRLLSLRIMRARLLLKDNRLQAAITEVNTLIAMSNVRGQDDFLQQAIACRDELLARLPAGTRPSVATATTPARRQTPAPLSPRP